MVSAKRVLIVEDSEDSRVGLMKLLEMEGYEVLEACDGAQAVEIAIKATPDLILMDVTLPVLDGLSATRRIREVESLNHVPVLFLTAHELDEFRQQVRGLARVDFVTKPVNFSALLDLMSRYLAG